MDYKAKYEQWCQDPIFDKETKAELSAIAGDEKEIEDRFYKDLSFGTGGLRGVIGAGTNRMNVYTVTKATQGLANYIKKQGGEDKGVAIAFDPRHMSVEFSEKAALCLNANGIKTYRFETLRPTPELSFALRELHCIAGIVVTASHNPPEYNGYKVYWEDGAQITAPKDKEIIAEVNAVTDFASIKMMDRAEAEEKGLFHVIGKEIDDRYMEELKKLVLSPDVIKEMADSLRLSIHRSMEPVIFRSGACSKSLGSRRYRWFLSRNCRMEIFQLCLIRTRKIRKHLRWLWNWQRRQMRIWFWQQTRMQIALVFMQKIPKPEIICHLPEICLVF